METVTANFEPLVLVQDKFQRKSNVFGMYITEMHNYFHHRVCKGPSLIILVTPEEMDNFDIHGSYWKKNCIPNRTNLSRE